MKIKSAITIAAATLCGSLSVAQANDGLFGALMGSAVKRDSTLGLQTGYGAQGLIGSPLSDRLNWEGNLFYSENDIKGFPGDITTFGGGFDLRYDLSEARTRPFLLGGAGGQVDDFKDVGGEKEAAPFINLGIGLTSRLGEKRAYRAELRGYAIHYKSFPGDNTVYDLRLNFGVSFGAQPAASSTVSASSPSETAAATIAATPAPVVAPAPQIKPAVLDKFALKGVTFATASDKLNVNSRPKLDAVAATLKANPEIKVDIHGYTDSRGNSERNLKLSQRRTESVKQYLIRQGIDAARLTATGHGAADPIDTNDTPAGRANNRRVELIAR